MRTRFAALAAGIILTIAPACKSGKDINLRREVKDVHVLSETARDVMGDRAALKKTPQPEDTAATKTPDRVIKDVHIIPVAKEPSGKKPTESLFKKTYEYTSGESLWERGKEAMIKDPKGEVVVRGEIDYKPEPGNVSIRLKDGSLINYVPPDGVSTTCPPVRGNY